MTLLEKIEIHFVGFGNSRRRSAAGERRFNGNSESSDHLANVDGVSETSINRTHYFRLRACTPEIARSEISRSFGSWYNQMAESYFPFRRLCLLVSRGSSGRSGPGDQIGSTPEVSSIHGGRFYRTRGLSTFNLQLCGRTFRCGSTSVQTGNLEKKKKKCKLIIDKCILIFSCLCHFIA